jgi:hypothetical protein
VKSVRESLSAPREDWDLLQEIQDKGLAPGRSGAFQYLCAEYRRHQQERGFLEAARGIDAAEFAALADTSPPPPTAPSWTALMGED